MSYYSKVQLVFEGSDYFASYSDDKIIPFLVEKALLFKKTPLIDNFDEIYFDDLTAVFNGELVNIHTDGYLFEPFLAFLSKEVPNVVFGARGFGEEFEDVWVYFYKNGSKSIEFPDSLG